MHYLFLTFLKSTCMNVHNKIIQKIVIYDQLQNLCIFHCLIAWLDLINVPLWKKIYTGACTSHWVNITKPSAIILIILIIMQNSNICMIDTEMTSLNKRPMGNIAHLRKQFKSINTYDYIITMIKRRKKTHYYLNEN